MSKGKTNRKKLAIRRMGEISALVHRVQPRDTRGIHVTVWLSPIRRVEWWPGSAKWASGMKGKVADMSGGFDDFLRWVSQMQK